MIDLDAGGEPPGFGLAIEVIEAFFALRVAGRRFGAVTERGQGAWGVMRLIARNGPQTVPRLAAARGVTRQYIQKLVDRLVAEGSLRVLDNPGHRRSHLVGLTDQGRERFDAIDDRVRRAMVELLADRPREDLERARDLIALMRGRLAEL